MKPYLRFLGLAFRRPAALPAMVGLAWAARRRRWWGRPPFLPLPPGDYLRWRNDTAFGDPTATGSDRELVRYLRWAAQMRRRSRAR